MKMNLAIGRNKLTTQKKCSFDHWQVPKDFSAQEIADFLAKKNECNSWDFSEIFVISVDINNNPVLFRHLLLDEDYV